MALSRVMHRNEAELLEIEEDRQSVNYMCISKEDMCTLFNNDHQTFDIQTPCGLQNRVWFNLTYHFCLRGGDNLRGISKNTFAVNEDASGEYVYQAITEDTSGEERMYATNDKHCPVLVYKKYVSKLTDHGQLKSLKR